MTFIIKPQRVFAMAAGCDGRCSGNCIAKCGSLGTCFCPLK